MGCSHDDFAYFHSSDSKSREDFLEILQAGSEKYVLNEEAKADLENYQLPQKHLIGIGFSDEPLATTKEEWGEHLLSSGITTVKTVRVLTEAALIGGLNIAGRSEPLRILSDGAGQFNVMQHGLCWIHIERGLRKLEGDNDQERENIVEMQGLLWDYYQELKQYQQQPRHEISLNLQDRFNEIFGKLGISFWNYLTSRLHGDEQVLSLSDVIRAQTCPVMIVLVHAFSVSQIRSYY